MARRWRPAWLVAGAVAVLTASCADGAPAPATGLRAHWLAGDRPWSPPVGDLLHPELAVLSVAEALDAGSDERKPRHGERRFIANAMPDGDLYFKGHRWSLRKSRAEALGHLDRELIALAAPGPGPEPTVAMLLRLDSTCLFAEVRDVVVTVSAGTRAAWQIQFAVENRESRVSYKYAHIDAVPRAATPEEEAKAIAVGWNAPAPGSGPRLRIGNRTWAFPAANDPYAPGPALDEANVRWGEVESALAASKGALRLEIEDDVPWAYVAETFDLALATRHPAVVLLPPFGAIDLSTPPPLDPAHLGARDPGDLPWWAAIGIGVLLAMLALAGALRSPRRRAQAT